MRFRVLLASGWLTAIACAFQASPPPAEPSFRVSVDLAQVDAVVTDSKGHHVTGLRAQDFEISEDGKPRKITAFSWIAVEPPPVPGSALTAPAHSLTKEDVRRSIVLMVDDMGPYAEHDLLPVMTAARKFVADQIAPGDLVSVTASRGGMGFYSQFSSDKAQLFAAIDHLSRRPGFGRWTVPTPEVMDDSGHLVPIPLAPGEPSYNFRGGDPPNPAGYLLWAIQSLRNSPGRKAVVLFSHSFTAPASILGAANRAGVVIYVIDPHGVDMGGVPRSFNIAGLAPYDMLAKQTGGLFIRSSPGANLNADLGKVLDDLSGYYLIGYRPDPSDLDPPPGRRAHHDIQVKVGIPGLTVRARNGFLGLPGTNPPAPAPRTTAEYLVQALFSPFNPGKIRLRVDPTYAASPPDPHTKLRQPVLRAMLEADGRDLQFAPAEDGKKKLVLGVLIALFNQDGTPAVSRQQMFTIPATPEDAARLTASGIHAVVTVKLPKPGPFQVRAAIRDETSGAIGSAYAFLDVPDFNRPQIALSSIELSPPQGGPSDSSGWNEYPIGASVHFECEVFGFRIAPQPSRQPRVEMQILLFREGESTPVFDSRILPVPPATLTENFLAGRLRIGSDFEPGDYTMQLLAYDRLASPKKQLASQWTNLIVATPPAR